MKENILHPLANILRKLPEDGELGISKSQKAELIRLLRQENPKDYYFQGHGKNEDATLGALERYFAWSPYNDNHRGMRYPVGRSGFHIHKEIIEGMRMVYKKERATGPGMQEKYAYGFYNRAGKLLVKPQFLSAYDFSQGLAAVQNSRSGKWGFIDKQGKKITPYKRDKVESFSCGKALVYNGDSQKYGYINLDGELDDMKYEFDKAVPYVNGVALVFKEGKGVFRRDTLGNLFEHSIEEYISWKQQMRNVGGKYF